MSEFLDRQDIHTTEKVALHCAKCGAVGTYWISLGASKADSKTIYSELKRNIYQLHLSGCAFKTFPSQIQGASFAPNGEHVDEGGDILPRHTYDTWQDGRNNISSSQAKPDILPGFSLQIMTSIVES